MHCLRDCLANMTALLFERFLLRSKLHDRSDRAHGYCSNLVRIAMLFGVKRAYRYDDLAISYHRTPLFQTTLMTFVSMYCPNVLVESLINPFNWIYYFTNKLNI